jgi:asparagine synthase (glutamine-hydrolysing)
MCGIAGYFGPATLPQERLDACLPLMCRRGPDRQAHRHWINGQGRNAYLLHSRLSIIDLDPRSDQPLHYGHTWIAFNGELYNYVELKSALLERGAHFSTESDSEVLAAVLDSEGWRGLDSCEGMWAFASYDERSGSLTLCRDRFGEKPLYLLRTAEGLYFGSEIKFLAALSGQPLTVDHDHLWRYLVNGYKALYKERRTFFREVSELSPGTVLTVDAAGAETLHRYWQPAVAADERMSFEDAVRETRARLLRAVEIRLRADVPIAFCMSGGVDSNALISIAKRTFGYDVHGFTILNTDARYEERDLVEASVRELGIRHTWVPTATTGFLQGLRELIRHHDSPISTITYYAHWVLMRRIHEAGYRISVSGTAADELFSGYYDHHLAYFQEVHRTDPALHHRAVEAWSAHVLPVVRNPFLSNPSLFIDDPSFRDHIFLDADEFAKFLRFRWHEPFRERLYSDHLLRNRMLNELFHESVPVILHEDDLNSMYFSIENRSPFLDRSLFEFAYTIPTRHLIREATTKAVLREAVRGIAPDPVLDSRRKVGFNAPILDFLDLSDAAVRGELLSDSLIYEFVDRDRIAAMLDRRELRNSESKFLFNFVNCRIFLEEFGGGSR